MLLYRIHYWLWDRRFEVDERVATSGTVPAHQLQPETTTHAELSYEYGASPRLVVDWILNGLRLDLRHYTFVDYGSGRGRVLLTAAGRPFRAVHGVEFCTDLHRAAVSNIAAHRENDIVCGDVRSHCCDVLDFPIPEGDIVLYFFNPFEAELLDRIMQRYTDACMLGHRRVVIVYYNARHHLTLAANKRIRPRRLAPLSRLLITLLSPHPVRVYEISNA